MTTYTNGGSQASATYYAIKDHQNTIIALADSIGTVVESYEYSAYGRILDVKDGSGNSIANQQSEIGNRYAFQGREIDWTTGLYYFRARWYDPVAGRFISKDPIRISGGLNLYAFVSNNPVNFTDPNGLCKIFHPLIKLDDIGLMVPSAADQLNGMESLVLPLGAMLDLLTLPGLGMIGPPSIPGSGISALAEKAFEVQEEQNEIEFPFGRPDASGQIPVRGLIDSPSDIPW